MPSQSKYMKLSHFKNDKDLIQQIRLRDHDELFDTIVFDQKFLENVDQIIQHFSVISDGHAFSKSCRCTYDHNLKSTVWDYPLWFNSNSFQTFGAWIVSNFEKLLWERYFEENKPTQPQEVLSDNLNSKISLEYRKQLLEFWKNLEKSKKKKLFSGSGEIFKMLTEKEGDNGQDDPTKEINYKLRSFYDKQKKKEEITIENVTSYFNQTFEEKSDDELIDLILLTPLEQCGTIRNLVFRKISHKLKNMFSEKIASALILNEEREKKKQNTKKKIPVKKSELEAKKDSLKPNEIEAKERKLEEEEASVPLLSKRDDDEKIPNETRLDKTTDSISPAKKKNKKSRKKEKAQAQKLETQTPVIDLEAQLEKKVEKEEPAADLKEDDFSIFDQFNNKLSRTQKKKQKRKQKLQMAQISSENENSERLQSTSISNMNSCEENKMTSPNSLERSRSCSTSSEEIKTPLIEQADSTSKIEPLIVNTEKQAEDTGEFIEIRPKKKVGKNPRDGFNEKKKKKNSNAQSNSKNANSEARSKTTRIYEVKRKVQDSKQNDQLNIETEKLPRSDSGNIQSQQKRSTSPSGSENEGIGKSNSSCSNKNHHLSLSSPSIGPEQLRSLKIRTMAEEFFYKKFTKDIYSHVAKITEDSNKMMEYRILAYKRVDFCLKKIFPKNQIKTKIYGSCATGLALVSSDVDVSVTGLDLFQRNGPAEYLILISEELKKFKWVTSNKPIASASTPVLKLVTFSNFLKQKEINTKIPFKQLRENESPEKDFILKSMLNTADTMDFSGKIEEEEVKIRIDLTFDNFDNWGGSYYHMGHKSTDLIQKNLIDHPSLYTLTIILKEFLNERGLLNAYQGGISSYCLVLMILAVLQKFGDGDEKNTFDKLIKKILNYYGEEFVPEKFGINIIEEDPFFPLNHTFETAPFWVIDAIDQTRNIGQSAYSIRIILNEFQKASALIEIFRDKIIDEIMSHKDKINTFEDIKTLDNPEFINLITSNIVDSFIKL